MNKHDLLEDIVMAFTNSVENFQKSSGGLSYCCFPKYKGAEDIDHLVYIKANIEYQTYIVSFRFTIHKTLMEINNILDCFICFDKTGELYYPLEYVLNYLDCNTLIPLIIPCISNAFTMNEWFQILSQEVVKIFDEISDISFHEIRQNELKAIVIKEIYEDKIPEDLEDEDYQYIHDFYVMDIMFTYFVKNGYIYFMLGDYETALKEFAKQKKKVQYENVMIELMKNNESHESFLPYTICYQLKKIYKIDKQKLNKKEIVVYMISMMIYSCIWFGIYYTVILMIGNCVTNGTLYFIGNQHDQIFNCILGAGIPAFVLSYLTREHFYYRLFKADYNNYKESQLIIDSPRQIGFMKKFFVLCVFLGFSIPCFELLNYVSFYDDGFVDNTSYFSLEGDYYHYDAIDKIYYEENEDNIFGEEIDPSIIIKMKNGEMIDLWEFVQYEYIEQEIFPFLIEKGVNIER